MKSLKKKIKKHLKEDIETFHEEAEDDRKLIKQINASKKKKSAPKKSTQCSTCKAKKKK